MNASFDVIREIVHQDCTLQEATFMKICDFYDEDENDQLCLIKCNNADYRASKSAQIAVSKKADFFFKTTLHVYLEPLLMREKLYFEPSINMFGHVITVLT